LQPEKLPGGVVAAVLGVNVAGTVAYCAIADAGVVEESEPFKVEPPAGMSGSAGLCALADDVERLIGERGIGRIVVVGAENSYKDTYASLTGRIGVEAAILIAGARAGIPAERLSRPEIRSKLGLPKSGQLSGHCAHVLPEAGKLWANKRDVAAMGAVSAGQS
jgi:hypothetical protein